MYKSLYIHHLLGMQTTSLTELSRPRCTWWSLRSRWMFTTRIISLDDGTYGKKKKVGRMVGFCFGQAGKVERREDNTVFMRLSDSRRHILLI